MKKTPWLKETCCYGDENEFLIDLFENYAGSLSYFLIIITIIIKRTKPKIHDFLFPKWSTGAWGNAL